ncbi:pentatricopeptide repeat-containing protein At4g18975, chloroplastic isoform X2 [Rosa chinensis]|uniref:pentatricopeptide repeat-containing protein At4g18975, chloroplastic isoform X2 n=1 Tax=Rosa chinensis TaxID=74649 RepID=UPI001AD8B8BE|nr:pentatricopeptide repeat-containing protein At4g18975, chloroplastic isoform X2 [Rosa chinensis]
MSSPGPFSLSYFLVPSHKTALAICNFWLPQLSTLKTQAGFFKTLSYHCDPAKGLKFSHTLQYNPRRHSWFLSSIMFASSGSSICCQSGINQSSSFLSARNSLHYIVGLNTFDVKCSQKQSRQTITASKAIEKKTIKKVGRNEHHLWKKKDSAGSGQKALNLVRIVSDLPNEKEAIFGALDKWTAWETEFPLIAAAKALRILRKRRQWMRVIQVAKWMLSKGQGTTMATYDTLLLAFDMDHRLDEAESLWNMILLTHTRSISKRLFSRMISLYDHHEMINKIIEVFADMEELSVRPDEDTVRRVARAFQELGQEDKSKLVLRRYGCKWKYIHFEGERVKVRTNAWDEDEIPTNSNGSTI